MHRVRYYSQLIEPSTFRGLRGWWIRVLNRLRFWLESRIVRHVMLYLARADGVKGRRLGDFRKEFDKDLKEERQLLTKKREPISIPKVEELTPPGERAKRYNQPRKQEQVRSNEDQSDVVFARYLEDGRRRRYVSRQPRYMDPDGDFEEVADAKGNAQITPAEVYGPPEQGDDS